MLNTFTDIRLFGVTLPRKGKEARGESFTFTGPVQFNWGYSLNKVNIVDSSTISSTFAGRTREGEGEGYGTFGKDYRVYYSFIVGQYPRLFLRVEHTGQETFIGDLRSYVKLEPVDVRESQIRDIKDVNLKMKSLIGELKKIKDKVAEIHCWQDKELIPKFAELIDDESLSGKIKPVGMENKS